MQVSVTHILALTLALASCSAKGAVTLVVEGGDAATTDAVVRDLGEHGFSSAGGWSPGSPIAKDVRALLAPVARAREVPHEFECRYSVARRSTVAKVALGFSPESIHSLDGAMLALPRADSWPFVTLLAAATSAGLRIEILPHLEAVPAPGAIGVIFAGSDSTAQFWLLNRQIDGTFIESGVQQTEAALDLGLRSDHVLCVRDGTSPRDVDDGELVLQTIPGPLQGAIRPKEQEGLAFKPDLQWGKRGTAPGDLSEPDGIAIDTKGRVLVGDEYLRKVHVFDAEGHYLTAFGGSGPEPGKFSGPVGGIAVSHTGNIYVLDPGGTRVNVYDSEYQSIRTFGRAGMKDGELFSPTGIAIGPDDRVYIADDGRNDVQVFQPDGSYVLKIGRPGTGPGELLGLESIAISRDNEVYIADEENLRIQVFDATGKLLRQIGDNIFQADVEGLTFDAEGRLWALDEDGGRALAFKPDGTLLGYLGGGPGTQPGQMMSPDGMVFNPANRLLYVADELNYRISAFKVDRMVAGRPPAVAGAAKSSVDKSVVLVRSGQVKEQVAIYAPLSKYLGEQLSTSEEVWEGRVRVTPTIDETIRLFRAREADVVIDSSLSLFKLIEEKVAEPLLAVGRKGTTHYHSVIFVAADSPITNVKELAGKTIAFEDHVSTSAFLLPSTILTAAGLELAELSDAQPAIPGKVGYRFANTERTIAGWVFGGRVDAGAFSHIDLKELGDLGSSAFRVLAESEEIAYYLVAVRADLAAATKAKLRDALLALPQQSNVADILKPPKLTEFLPLDDPSLAKPYAGARAAYARVDARLWK